MQLNTGVSAVPDTGSDLGVDCYKLFVAGSSYLPEVATKLQSAAYKLDDSARSDNAFIRSDLLGGGMWGPAYAPFAELRQQLTEMLEFEETALREAGQALVTAAYEYQET